MFYLPERLRILRRTIFLPDGQRRGGGYVIDVSNGPWNMFISDPPVSKAHICHSGVDPSAPARPSRHCVRSASGRPRQELITIVIPEGITFGDLVQEVRREHGSRHRLFALVFKPDEPSEEDKKAILAKLYGRKRET